MNKINVIVDEYPTISMDDVCNHFQQIGKTIIAHRVAQLKINKAPWWNFWKRRKQHRELKQAIALYAAGTAIRKNVL